MMPCAGGFSGWSRGTGMRLGELIDLELGCLWDLPGHGTWVKVPLGKLDTERVVPLDPATLAAMDTWMTARGRQRALPHPRGGRPTDFLFTTGGHRMGTATPTPPPWATPA
jgi:integrase